MNFVELKYNYRSLSPIVGFTNLIQLWRKQLFELPEIQPQQARRHGQFLPQKFILGQNISPEILKPLLKDAIIIIPCDEGGEIDYLRQDALLSQLFEPDTRDIPWNIFSAIAAKGLEFSQVILYKFGELCPVNIWQQCPTINEAAKYFFNKLYVATSRATERLFIIDSPLGDRQLWQQTSPKALRSFISCLNPELKQPRRTILLQAVTNGVYPESIANNNLESIAEIFVSEGLKSENPELLRRAQNTYLRLGDRRQSLLAQALALKLEGNLRAAGDIFLHQGKFTEAWQCFWQDFSWSQLWQWYSQVPPDNPKFTQQFFLRPLVDFMMGWDEDKLPGYQQVQILTNFLLVQDENINLEDFCNSPHWQQAVNVYRQAIQALISDDRVGNFKDLINYANSISKLSHCGYQVDLELAALCLSLAREIALKDEEISEAILAYFATNKETDKILEKWKKAARPKQKWWLKYVAPALEAKQLYQQAFFAYCYLDNPSKVKFCFEQATEGQPEIKFLILILQYYLRHQYWHETLATLQTYLQAIASQEAEKTGLKFELVYEIAHSQLTPASLNKKARQSYERFFQEHILKNYQWQKFLFVQHMGIALEKIAALDLALKFYAEYVSHPNQKVCNFARHRWLATQKKRENLFRHNVQVSQVKKAHILLEKQSKEWVISLQDISLEPPVAPLEKPEVINGKISGLPKGTLVHLSQDGIMRFELHNLKIEVFQSLPQVLLTDLLTRKEIRIDGESQQIQIGSVVVKPHNGDSIYFSEPTRSYEGLLICSHPHPRCELKIENFTDIIKIFF